MLDKNNDSNNINNSFGMDDNFADEFDNFPPKGKANPLDPNFGEMDNFSFEHDPDDPLNDPLDPDNPNTANLNQPPKMGIVELIKTYGIAALVVLVVGYFGIKYSFRAVSGADDNTTIAQSADVSSDNVITPVADNKALPDEVTPPKNFDALNNIAKAQAPKDSNEVLPPAVVPSASMIVASPTGSITPAVTTPMVSPEVKQDVENLKKMLNDLTQQLVANKDLGDNNISDIKQQVQQLVIYIQGVGKGVSILSSEIAQQQKAIEGILAGVPVPRKINGANSVSSSSAVSTSNVNSKASNNNASNLIVEAVIAGRAWIRTSNTGKTISVGLGDEIPGFGKVLAIDPVKATIITDDGSELSLSK